MVKLANKLFDFIEAANSSKSVAELTDHYSKAILAYGYDRFMYSMMTYDPVHAWHKVPSIARNYPEDWMAFYIEKGFMAIDPLRHLAFQARRAIVWDDVPNLIPLTKTQEQCLRQGIESGLYNGIGVPFHGPFGEVAGIGLASSNRNRELTPSIVSEISLISSQFHTSHIDLALGALARPKVQLTGREREVLAWCAAGKSNWAISEILGISEHAVKFHVANCIRKLEADGKVTAVLKAIRLGLISP